MNALEMEFEDDTFDLVWACESGEHMPDKAKYVQEMTRVLKPGTPASMPYVCAATPSTWRRAQTCLHVTSLLMQSTACSFALLIMQQGLCIMNDDPPT